MQQNLEDSPLLPKTTAADAFEPKHTLQKLDRRVLFFVACISCVSYIDRSNISYAARSLCNDLDMKHKEYAMGITLFFLGYVISQVISSVLMRRFGVPFWLSFLMCSWGFAGGGLGFIQNKTQFYILRFLLGLAEGGTFPGVYYYLSLFYPYNHLTGACVMIYMALIMALPISSPFSAALISLEDVVNVDGWRILFVSEGALSIVFALYLYTRLYPSVDAAPFLDPEEKEWIKAEKEAFQTEAMSNFLEEAKHILSKQVYWWMTLVGLLIFGSNNCTVFWLTLLIDDMLFGEDDDDDDDETCGVKHGSKILAILLTAIPYLLAMAGCFFVRWLLHKGHILDRAKFLSRMFLLVGALLLVWFGFKSVSFAPAFIALSLAVGISIPVTGVLDGLVITWFDPRISATTTAFYNATCSLGPLFFSPTLGILLDDYGYGPAFTFCASCVLLCSAIVWWFIGDPIIQS